MNRSDIPTTAGPRRSTAWPAFADRLAAVLGQLAEDQFLILSVKGGSRCVQFAAQGAFGLRAETVGNAFLPESEQLDEAALASLHALGWLPPTGSPEASTPEQDPDGSPNPFIDFPAPVDAAAVADLAVQTLVEVLGVSHPVQLEYRSFDAVGGTQAWSELGLQRADADFDPEEAARRLLATMREEIGSEAIDFDAEGDIGVRYGSAMVWVRLVGHPSLVHMRCSVLRCVDEGSDLLARLNELNAGIEQLRFFHRDGCVRAVAEVSAQPWVQEHVVRVLRQFCRVVDSVDELLQAEFGGDTAFAEDVTSAFKH